MDSFTPSLCRAARALLDWTQEDLATAAKVGTKTVRNFENQSLSPQTGQPLRVMRSNLAAMRTAMEAAGIEFDATPGRIGVALRMPQDTPQG